MASNNIDVSGAGYLPGFHGNNSGGIVHTDHTRSTGDPGTGNTIDSVGHYYGGCSAHWGPNVVYNHLEAQGLIPQHVSDANICAADINSLKNIINTLISGWTQGGDIRTYSRFSDTNDKISATYVNNVAYANTNITYNLWSDVLDRLTVFDNADDIEIGAQINNYYPTIGTTINRVDYNNLVNAIKKIAKSCKCNSDCACNLVCNCNADCGCNYSDRRLKENIIFLQYEHGLKIYQYNYISDKDTIYKGIIAQDLIGTKYEEAIHLRTDGYYKVNYNKLPIKLIKLKY